MGEIKLVFDSVVKGLAGKQYGKNIYQQRISKSLGMEETMIVFPETIEDISASFIEGVYGGSD